MQGHSSLNNIKPCNVQCYRYCEGVQVQSFSSVLNAYIEVLETLRSWYSQETFISIRLVILEILLLYFFTLIFAGLSLGFICRGFCCQFWWCQAAQVQVMGGGLVIMSWIAGILATWVRMGTMMPK